MSESFSAFREQYLQRHENPVNSALQTVADVVEVGGLIAGVVMRRIRVRGHEKVPTGGQLEVSAGGQIKVSTPCSSCRSGTAGPDGDG